MMPALSADGLNHHTSLTPDVSFYFLDTLLFFSYFILGPSYKGSDGCSWVVSDMDLAAEFGLRSDEM